jgi:hypothetical protein
VKKTNGKPGRPEYVATPQARKMVEALAAYGIPQAHIAKVLPVAIDTLRKHFAKELEVGSTKATAKVAEFLFQKASGARGNDHGAVTAAIFWMKARAGWKDRQDISLENSDGSPLTFTLKLEDHARGSDV